jgi:hypothetical protein
MQIHVEGERVDGGHSDVGHNGVDQHVDHGGVDQHGDLK